MRCYFCHICDKEFYSESQETELSCQFCKGEFIEEVILEQPKKEDVREPELDSEGNEFLSCNLHSEEDQWEDDEGEEDQSPQPIPTQQQRA